MKKRVLAMMLSLAMCFSMTACGSTNNSDNTTSDKAYLFLGFLSLKYRIFGNSWVIEQNFEQPA